jgi:plastocyanin
VIFLFGLRARAAAARRRLHHPTFLFLQPPTIIIGSACPAGLFRTGAPMFSIEISPDLGFVPAETTIPCNASVTWRKAAAGHGDGKSYEIAFEHEFAPVSDTQTYTRTFSRPGRFSFTCRKYLFLQGAIIVHGPVPAQPLPSDQHFPSLQATRPPDYSSFADRPGSTHGKLGQIRANRHSDPKLSSTSSPERKAAPPKFLFGSFGEDDDEQEPRPSPALASDGAFDAAAAVAFLRQRWLADANDPKVVDL